MDDNLQAILDLAGVNAAMVFDDAGRLVAQRGKAIYDRPLCEKVSVTLAKALNAIELQSPGWESVTAQYAGGTILLRSLGAVAGASYVLAVVADATLNPAFATVALRVASNKARRSIELGQGLTPTAASSAVFASSVGNLPRGSSSQILATTQPPGSGSRPMLATSGVSWSQVGTSGFSTKGFAADAAALAYLNRCSKALAQYVGPMAKVFVEEAVRRISPDAPFPMTKARPLAEELASQVEEAKDRSAFLKALQTTDATDRGKSETLTTFADRSAVIFRLKVLHDEILPAYHALVGSGEKVLIQELLERARPLAAKARSGLGPNLIIQSELTEALRKLTSGATLFGDLERLAKATLVPGLVDILCVPWERKETPVQRTWGCSLSEYLEPQSAWITNSLLRGVPRGTELKLPNGVPVRLCAPEEVDRLRRELAQVPRPSGPEVLQREYDTLVTMADTITSSRDLDLALWSR